MAGLGGVAWKLVGLMVLVVSAICFVLAKAGGRRERRQAVSGGAGRVVGIVGRMGSGKSYMAVRLAYNRLLAGARVCTNFTMNLPPELAKNWRQFRGWEDFAELENCIVIIDEAQLYAPSNKVLSFPTVARWKLAQARKFKLDVYWISQHENRVNSVLRDLTHMIYVCQAWLGGKTFMAYGFEPENIRKKGQHIDRQTYRFKQKIGDLYDTLQILDADEHLTKGDAALAKAQARGHEYNERRGAAGVVGGLARRRRCTHEIAASATLGICDVCPPMVEAS
ncbi:MAG: zonular occludens toxin domain-containing protein [Acidimicrobiales bacterium]